MGGVGGCVFTFLVYLLMRTSFKRHVSQDCGGHSVSRILGSLSGTAHQCGVDFVCGRLRSFAIAASFHGLSLRRTLKQIFKFCPVGTAVRSDLVFIRYARGRPAGLVKQIVSRHRQPIRFTGITLLGPESSSFLANNIAGTDNGFIVPYNVGGILTGMDYINCCALCGVCGIKGIKGIILGRDAVRVGNIAIGTGLPSFGVKHRKVLVSVRRSSLSGMKSTISMLQRLPHVGIDDASTVDICNGNAPVVCVGGGRIESSERLRHLGSSTVGGIRVVASPNTECSTAIDSIVHVQAIGGRNRKIDKSLGSVM